MKFISLISMNFIVLLEIRVILMLNLLHFINTTLSGLIHYNIALISLLAQYIVLPSFKGVSCYTERFIKNNKTLYQELLTYLLT